MKKHKCCICNRTAVWSYLPAGASRRNYCDEHVPRGCVCNVDNIKEFGEPPTDTNVMWWSKEAYEKHVVDNDDIENYAQTERQPDSFYYEILDECSRRSPCVEYDYSENGYEIENNMYYATIEDIKDCITKALVRNKFPNHSITIRLGEIVKTYIDANVTTVLYADIMSEIHDVCYEIYEKIKNDKITKFYRSLRGGLYLKRKLLTDG